MQKSANYNYNLQFVFTGPRVYPHTNVRDFGEQARGEPRPVYKNQLQSFADFCSETNVVGGRGQKEEEGARTQADCWRRHT